MEQLEKLNHEYGNGCTLLGHKVRICFELLTEILEDVKKMSSISKESIALKNQQEKPKEKDALIPEGQ